MSTDRTLRMTLVGGPTLLIEVAGYRLLTDPTFDVPGEYRSGPIVLRKLAGPSIPASAIGAVDAVLLSHDQHADNLDPAGRTFLEAAPRVLTTVVGAKRLGGRAEGLAPWASTTLSRPGGPELVLTATPARHGPPGIEPIAGEVVGFVASLGGEDLFYATGDTVWYEGVAEVARRFKPKVAILFTGAARTRGALHLTMSVNDALEAERAFASSTIVSVHNHGWAHFSESEDDLAQAFKVVGVEARLQRLAPGGSLTLSV